MTAPFTSSLPVMHTSFHGRADEVADVVALLRAPSVQLVTLVGPAGVGKTRLAVRVAESLLSEGNQRVVYVSLAALEREGRVLDAIARSIAVSDSIDTPLLRAIAAALGDRPTVLVLDNLEHMLNQAADIGALLSLSPDLRVLATSRAPLEIRGENVYSLSPMLLPAHTDRLSLAELEEQPAVALFVARAQAVQHDFALTAVNRAAVVSICERLDGLPLALELAAARTRMLPPVALLARLDRPLDALRAGPLDAPDRHRSLHAALDWSYTLLSAPERHLFARLSAPAGSFTLAAVDALRLGLDLDPLDALASLVNKSLIHPAHLRQDDGVESVRFEMLAVVREFALEKLAENGEYALAHDIFAAFVTSTAALVRAEFPMGPVSGDGGFDVLGVDREPALAALDWLHRSGQHRAFIAASAALAPHWFARGALRDARAVLERALAVKEDDNPVDVARVTVAIGMVAIQQGDFAYGEARLLSGLELAKLLGAAESIGQASFSLGVVEQDRGRPERAIPLFATARASFMTVDRSIFAAVALNNLGLVTARAGVPQEGLRMIAEARRSHLEAGYRFGAALADRYAGQVLLELGERTAARAALQASLQLDPTHMQGWHVANAVETLARLDLLEGQDERAIRLAEGATRLREEIGVPIEPALLDGWTQFQRALSERFDDQARAAVRVEAQGRSLEDLIALAVAPTEGAPLDQPSDIHSQPVTNLTLRELEVLALLVEGQSNGEIADRLYISPRTVSVHVTHILEKLGVENRSAAVAFALRSGLVSS